MTIKCCHEMEIALHKENASFRSSEYIIYSIKQEDGYFVEQALDHCHFCGASLSPKNTHELEGILDKKIELLVDFGDVKETYKYCEPVDFSIYEQGGYWLCTNDRGIGEIHEKDIYRVQDAKTGEVFYDRST